MIVLMMSAFVLLYVWQNIEVMRMKMEYRKLVGIEHELSEERSRLVAEHERLRNFGRVENSMSGRGVRRIVPSDMLVVKSEENRNDGKDESR